MDSSWLFGIAITVVSIGIAVAGIRLVRRRIPLERLQKHNDVAGPIHATIGVIYAVLLAFVVVVVWEEINVAHDSVLRETSELVALNHDLSALNEPDAMRVHVSLKGYVGAVLGEEWRTLEKGRRVIRSTPEYERLWGAVRRVSADGKREEIWLEAVIDRLNAVDEWRSQRLLAVESGVPLPLWVLLVCGGLVTILFAALFGTEHRPMHSVMVGSLAALIAFTLFLILALDHPFHGVVRVESIPFDHALEQIENNPPTFVRPADAGGGAIE